MPLAKPKDSGVAEQVSPQDEPETSPVALLKARVQAYRKEAEEKKRQFEEIEKLNMRDMERTRRGFGLPAYPVL
jgi:hypothetical protein